MDEEGRWHVARSHAIQLGTTVIHVHFMVTRAFPLNWWEHHHGQWLDGGALFLGNALSIGARSEMTLLAGTTGDANSWADGVGFVAGPIASLALTELLVHATHLGIALVGSHAPALLVLQESRLAETSGHTLEGADGAWIGVGTGRGTCRSAGQVDLVLALAILWWEGEEEGCLGGIALGGGHTHTDAIPQVSILAEAPNHTVLGAHGAGMGVGAGGGARRSTCLKLLVVRASGQGSCWDLHGDSGHGLAIAF